jgi:hypothetical protein
LSQAVNGGRQSGLAPHQYCHEDESDENKKPTHRSYSNKDLWPERKTNYD